MAAATTNGVMLDFEKLDEEERDKYKLVLVEKAIDLQFDVGNLLATDPNPIEVEKLRANEEAYLKELARDDTQLLINRIWELPTQRLENIIVAKLPDPVTRLPREKPIPKPKPATRWQEFAKKKGIQQKKKEKLRWDETKKDWLPTYGYKRAKEERNQEWLIELPKNADPNVDYFSKKKEEKKERVAKNEYQRLRNIARARKSKVPTSALLPVENPSRDQVSKTVTIAKKATASLGKFTDTLPNEKRVKVKREKRKFQPNIGDLRKEKENHLRIISELSKKRPKLDVVKATNKFIREEEIKESKERSKKKIKGGRGKKGGGGKKGGKKRNARIK